MLRITSQELHKLILWEMRCAKNPFLRNAQRIKFPKDLRILGTSIKVQKNKKTGALTSILYMSPHHESIQYGGRNFCPMASKGCSFACLGAKSKRLSMNVGHNSKIWKSLLWVWRPDILKDLLFREIESLRKKAYRKGLKPSVRLNGATDIIWERKIPNLFSTFPDVQFYDYTKIATRFNNLPPNYHLTFSRSESNEKECMSILRKGFNVAVVFQDLDRAIKTGWKGYPVFNADESDYRPSDPFGIAGLSVKSHINPKKSNGFVVLN